ncbi:vegetative cell wall protein gp1-like [Iris pallida]|uniref:Vegetative cell wall protein gp1-like n=1 Tax=Iris pallida TaxID=29817 RepID=A0AAX6FDQ7_IRIPA|nr:vegetative cell wall protein gp1-like [Iris pallida]
MTKIKINIIVKEVKKRERKITKGKGGALHPSGRAERGEGRGGGSPARSSEELLADRTSAGGMGLADISGSQRRSRRPEIEQAAHFSTTSGSRVRRSAEESVVFG